MPTLITPLVIRPLSGYRIYLEFSDGAKGNVDLSELVGKGVFEIWNDKAAFETVHIGKHREIQMER